MKPFTVGQRAICKSHQEDVTITEVIREGYYKAKIDRFDDVELRYYESELEPWKFRRFVIDGNHYMRMHDDSNTESKLLGEGSWGIRDIIQDQILFYVTSGASRMIAVEICKQMNNGTLLQEFLK